MSIALPVGLPTRQSLLAEGVEVLEGDDLRRWGRRPLRVCLVNLMPNKIATETQIARLLGATAIPVELTLCVPDSYRSRTTPASHLASFYRTWPRIRDEPFDGLVVTGAPVEMLPFETVDYWPELVAILDWARSRAIRSFHICWAAQAALYRFHGVPKHALPAKVFGVFSQQVAKRDSRLLAGFGDAFPVPVSRYAEVRATELPAAAGLEVLAASEESGLCLVEDRANRAVCMFNHLEYDTGTLADEFLRDRRAGRPVGIPRNYFPNDDSARSPVNGWRPYAHLLFANWLGELHRAAWPRVADEPMIQWALAEPRLPPAEDGDHADFLLSAADGPDVLASALRALADLGIAPRALKVHRRPGLEQLIELRADRMEGRTAERVATRLGLLAAVFKVAFRGHRGIGGWLVGSRMGAEAVAQGGRAAGARCEAA